MSGRPISPRAIAEAQRLRDQGHSLNEIAKRLRLSYKTVRFNTQGKDYCPVCREELPHPGDCERDPRAMRPRVVA